MLLYLSLIGIFLSLILIFFNGRKLKSSLYLGFFFFQISLFGITHYAMAESQSVLLVTIFDTNFTFLSYLIGPALYWYVRSVLNDRFRLKKIDFLHLIPSLVHLIAALPFIFSAYSYKVAIAAEVVKDRSFLGIHKFTFLSEIFPIYVVYLSRPILVFAYTLWSIGLFIRFLIRKQNKMVFSHQNFMTKWLSLFLLFQFILTITYLTSTFKTFIQYSDVFLTLNMLQVLSAVGMCGLLISPFFFPSILYGLPFVPDSVKKTAEKTEEVHLSPDELKRYTPNFEADYLLTIEKKTKFCMQEFQAFLQPDLNLNKFSKIIELPAHHLAYYFREVRKQSFNDYCNECRVDYAKNLIKGGKTGELTLEAVGALSGFTNRSTFFRAFKKAEGVAPGSYLAKRN